MGAEIHSSTFTLHEYDQFHCLLKKETLLLGQWLNRDYFCDRGHSFGVELESWILDKNSRPNPINIDLVNNIKHKQVVYELSKYNIEINGSAFKLSSRVFSNIHKDMKNIFSKCQNEAEKSGALLMLSGTVPHMTPEDLNINSMTPQNRYMALNKQLFKAKDKAPSEIFITGKDELRLTESHIMPASAATSFQVHWKIPISKAVEVFNASQVSSAVAVALSANSPYVFGRELWEESRIPLFEHAISSSPFLAKSKIANRTGFGSNYIETSISDYFLENFLNHKVILPKEIGSEMRDFSHLKLHNGTIWHWNRPVIGENEDGTPHIRIEHRAQSAGPSIIDSTANMAFFIGLTYFLSQSHIPMEFQLPFSLAEKNFYKAARSGLKAQVSWFHGQQYDIKTLILDKLLDQSAQGLKLLGIEEKEINHLIFDVIKNRVITEQTGSQWQKKTLRENNKDFQKMSLDYIKNQNSGEPVYKWK